MLASRNAAFRATIFFIASLIFMYIALLLIINSTRFQKWLTADLLKRTGYEIAGELRLDPLLRLNLSGVAASKASKPVLQAERISVVITPVAFFSKNIHRLRLEKPILYLELNELMQDQGADLDLNVRHLSVEDGTLVLNLGNGQALDFKSLAMNAENVNFGQAAGLKLRTDVPWLNGMIEVVVTGDESDKVVRLRLEQPTRGKALGKLSSGRREPDAVAAQLRLISNADASLAVVGAGKLNDMMIGGEPISGHFEARANIGANREQADITAELVATELPSQVHFLPIALPEGTSTGVLEGRFSLPDKKMALRSFRVQSPLGDASGSAQIAFAPEIVIASSKVALRKAPVEPLKSLLPRALSALASDGVLDADLELHGPWRSVEIRGTVEGSGIQLRNEQFSLAALNFKTPVEWANSSFRAADLQITATGLLARQTSEMPISAEELRVSGSLEQKAGAPLHASGQIRVQQGRFTSLDGTRVGENLTLNGRFETTSRPDTSETAIAGNLAVEQGEVLWGKFFGDLRSQRPSLQFQGDYIAGTDALRLRELIVGLATIGKIAVRGDVEQTSRNLRLRLDINSDNIQPAGFFEFFVRSTLNRSFPMLNQLTVAGRLGFTVKAQGTLDNLAVQGALQLSGGEVQNKSKRWQVGPIQLDLPFSLQYPGASAAPSSNHVPTGNLALAGARFGSETVPSTKTTLSLWDNALIFHQPIRLPIYGGVLEISDLAFRNLIENPQAVSLSVEAKNLQLQKLTALGGYRFGGTLSGSIPKIEWGSGSLRSEGNIRVEVFGGRVQITKLEVDSPFSSFPSIKLDALFRNISLEQASRTFAFGQISGILEGTVNGLVMTAGQPSEFRADVRSVEKSGVSQRISVESLNKITVLSSGNDAGALYGGIASFFDSFRYSKLGFRAVLKNDKLTLRGVESRQDGEYLVVGSLIPPTVNVVSHTQVIGFSELLRRLERIRESERVENPAN
jgi:hypothetical protein